MALLNTLNDFAKNVGEKTSGTLEATKLVTKIMAQRKIITEAEQKIGEYYYKKISEDGTPDDEVKAYFDQIAEIQENIDEMEARIAAIKAAAENPLDPGKKLCAHCGAVIPVKSKFCPECGAPNAVEEATVVEPGDENTEEAQGGSTEDAEGSAAEGAETDPHTEA
jgi:hypothetical protein